MRILNGFCGESLRYSIRFMRVFLMKILTSFLRWSFQDSHQNPSSELIKIQDFCQIPFEVLIRISEFLSETLLLSHKNSTRKLSQFFLGNSFKSFQDSHQYSSNIIISGLPSKSFQDFNFNSSRIVTKILPGLPTKSFKESHQNPSSNVIRII